MTRNRFADGVGDTVAIAQRNMIAMVRVPQVIVFSFLQPVILVLMFRYVFGGAINVPGDLPYVDFLMAGIFVQTVTFGSITTGVVFAEDVQKGLIERFRSLPMARVAVLAGRCVADLVRNTFTVILMVAIGFAVGFRNHTTVLGLVGAMLLILLFGFAMSWILVFLALVTGNGEAVQAAAFPLMALLVFASNSFVPTATMPRWLAAYADHQPVSAMVDAVRALTLGGPTAGKVVTAVLWMLAITAVFVPLSVWRYRRVS